MGVDPVALRCAMMTVTMMTSSASRARCVTMMTALSHRALIAEDVVGKSPQQLHLKSRRTSSATPAWYIPGNTRVGGFMQSRLSLVFFWKNPGGSLWSRTVEQETEMERFVRAQLNKKPRWSVLFAHRVIKDAHSKNN